MQHEGNQSPDQRVRDLLTRYAQHAEVGELHAESVAEDIERCRALEEAARTAEPLSPDVLEQLRDLVDEWLRARSERLAEIEASAGPLTPPSALGREVWAAALDNRADHLANMAECMRATAALARARHTVGLRLGEES